MKPIAYDESSLRAFRKGMLSKHIKNQKAFLNQTLISVNPDEHVKKVYRRFKKIIEDKLKGNLSNKNVHKYGGLRNNKYEKTVYEFLEYDTKNKLTLVYSIGLYSDSKGVAMTDPYPVVFSDHCVDRFMQYYKPTNIQSFLKGFHLLSSSCGFLFDLQNNDEALQEIKLVYEILKKDCIEENEDHTIRIVANIKDDAWLLTLKYIPLTDRNDVLYDKMSEPYADSLEGYFVVTTVLNVKSLNHATGSHANFFRKEINLEGRKKPEGQLGTGMYVGNYNLLGVIASIVENSEFKRAIETSSHMGFSE